MQLQNASVAIPSVYESKDESKHAQRRNTRKDESKGNTGHQEYSIRKRKTDADTYRRRLPDDGCHLEDEIVPM
jgi:hypothetical protein